MNYVVDTFDIVSRDCRYQFDYIDGMYPLNFTIVWHSALETSGYQEYLLAIL